MAFAAGKGVIMLGDAPAAQSLALMRWMGHSSFATTANIYAHIDTDSKQEAADMIASCIRLSGEGVKNEQKKQKSSLK